MIAAMAVVASILVSAVFQSLAVVREVQNRNELRQLRVAVMDFKRDRQVDHFPSYFDPNSLEGKKYWHQMFGAQSGSPADHGITGPLEWDQCLVLFLGGLRQDGKCYGFSSNPLNPMSPPMVGESRIGPFFNFAADRLLDNGGYADRNGNAFVCPAGQNDQ
jgi:hypothetical protein